jgi:hypothetical protein
MWERAFSICDDKTKKAGFGLTPYPPLQEEQMMNEDGGL